MRTTLKLGCLLSVSLQSCFCRSLSSRSILPLNTNLFLFMCLSIILSNLVNVSLTQPFYLLNLYIMIALLVGIRYIPSPSS